MRIVDTSTLLTAADIQALSTNHRDWCYNGLDVCVTLEIRDALLPQLDPITRNTYNFSLALQAPILEMTARGVLVDQGRRAEVLTLYRAQIKQLDEQLTYLVRDGVGFSNALNVVEKGRDKYWWNSTDKLKNLLYDVMGLPEKRKRNAKGEFSPTVDRDSLESLGADYWLAEPLVSHILLLRDITKKIEFLTKGIDPDGRIRTNFNIGGTNTGRLASSMSDFGTGGNLQNVDRELRSVFVADPGYKFGNLDLEQGDARNVGAICWNLFVEQFGEDYAGSYLDACESGDLHTYNSRLIWPDKPWTGDLKSDKALAEQIFYRQDSYRQMSKKGGHGCLTADHEVLTPNGWVNIDTCPDIIMQWSPSYSNFTKVAHWEAKPYTGYLQSFEGQSISALMTHDHRIPFIKDQKQPIFYEQPAERGPGKYMPLGSGWVGGAREVPARLMAAFMADGHQKSANIMEFHFHKKRKFDRLIKLCELYNFEYSLKLAQNKITVVGYLPKHPGSFMFLWTRKSLSDFVDELKYWDGTIGETAVSISSINREDLKWFQTFGRIVGIGGNLQKPQRSGFGSITYRLQQNHRQFASGSSVKHQTKIVEDVMVYCPNVESSWFYIRRNGKISVSGNTNYYGTPRTMAKHLKVPTSLITNFQEKYFSVYPVIGSFSRNPTLPNWHNAVRGQLRDSHYLTTMLGRRRFFYGRAEDDSTLREAIAYEPQSMTADEIDLGLLTLWRANRVQLLIQVHDSILFQYPENQEDTIIPWALETLKTYIKLKRGRDFVVPTEAKVGYNWGEFADTNPDGLVKWKGADPRIRTDAPWQRKKFSIFSL